MKLSNFYTYTIGNPILTRGVWIDLTESFPIDDSYHEQIAPENGILLIKKAGGISSAGGALDKTKIMVSWINSVSNAQTSSIFVLKGEKYFLQRNGVGLSFQFQSLT